MLGIVNKDPDDLIDIDVDFSRWMPADDSLDSATATSDKDTLFIESVGTSDNIVKIWVSHGVNGETVCIDVLANTTIGRTKNVSFQIRMKEGCSQ